jgi:hypothetical protein
MYNQFNPYLTDAGQDTRGKKNNDLGISQQARNISL